MQQNFDIFDFRLSDDDMNQIKSLDKDQTAFYSHYDPEAVERLNNIKFEI